MHPGNYAGFHPSCRDRSVPLWEVLGLIAALVARDCWHRDIPADNVGAASCEGLVGGQQRTRAVGIFEDLVYGEVSCLQEEVVFGGRWSFRPSWVVHGRTLVEL